jgi:hypothetical protein
LLIPIRQVPRYERHLLYCTDRALTQRRRKTVTHNEVADAPPRTSAIPGEAADAGAPPTPVDPQTGAWLVAPA